MAIHTELPIYRTGVRLLTLPLYGFQITGGQAFSMGLIFTVISVVRSYIIRRYFNARLRADAQGFAERVSA